MKPSFLISIALNLFFILAAILFTCFFWDIDVSSKMGGTLGGTLGPLINIVAIFYIFNSYQDQKEALGIQRAALQDDRQSAKDQVSIAFHSEVSTSLKEVEQVFQQVTFEISEPLLNLNGLYQGREALTSYPRIVNMQDFFSELLERDERFLATIIHVYSKFHLVASRKQQLEPILTQTHSEDLRFKMEAFINDYVKPIDAIFKTLTIFGHMFPIVDNGNAANLVANRTMGFIFQYQDISISLENYGLKNRAAIDPAFEPPEFNFDPQIPLDEGLRASINWDLEY